MEPISAALLLALVGGAAGAAGQQAWAALTSLVRRPPRPGEPSPGAPELAAMEERPTETNAQELARALDDRAGVDADFARALAGWTRETPRLTRTEQGDVNASVTGNVEGNVVTLRDVHGSINFGTPPPPPPGPPGPAPR